MASYELWQTRTRNLIGAFATQAEALAVVRRAAETHGPGFIDTVLLGREDDKGHSRTVAQGKDLLELANVDERKRAVLATQREP
jgi:hypothetical protein